MEIRDKFVLSRAYLRDFRIGAGLFLVSLLFIGFIMKMSLIYVPVFIVFVYLYANAILSYACAPLEFYLDEEQFTIKYQLKSTVIPLRDIVSIDVIPADFFRGIWWRSLQLRFKGIQGVYFNKDGNTDYYFICNYNERVRILLKWDKSYIISFTDMEFVKQLYKQFGQLQPDDDR